VLFAVTWGVMQLFCGPILGMLSDRIGRRPVLLISLGGLAVDFLFMAFAPNLAWLFVGRVINGMTAASFSTANAYVADVTPPKDRAKAFGGWARRSASASWSARSLGASWRASSCTDTSATSPYACHSWWPQA
jgi:MFS family permease